MDLADIEGEAEAIYRAAGFDSDEQAPSVALARRLLGPEAIRNSFADRLPGNGALVRVGNDWRIYIRAGAEVRVKRFVLLHELAHWALGARATEEDCDALAAALLVPRRAFIRHLRSTGVALPRLARVFSTTESCVALRLGEATDQPLVLVAPRSVRVRGREWSWPNEESLRALARGHAPGLKKTRLREDSRRVVLRAI